MFRQFFESERLSRHGRLFQKGDIKYVILDLLNDKPSHGYEIIRALEERFHGFYSPSAGSIYPTLQLLEDMGYVTSSPTEGKKVFSITDEGRRFLADREEIVDEIRGHIRDWWGMRHGKEFGETFQAWGDVARLVARRSRRINEEKLTRIKEIIVKARRDIEEVLGEEK